MFRVEIHISKLPPTFAKYSFPGFSVIDKVAEAFGNDSKHKVAMASSQVQLSTNQMVILFIVSAFVIMYLTNSTSRALPVYPRMQRVFSWLLIHSAPFSAKIDIWNMAKNYLHYHTHYYADLLNPLRPVVAKQ